MTVNLSALAGAGQQFFSNSGVPLNGGKLYSYAAGTTTPQTCYTSASGATPHANPIILDSSGRVATGEIWLTAGSNYKFVLTDSNDVLIATWDNITGVNGTGIASNASNVQYDPTGSGAVSTTVQAKLRQTVSVKDFGAVGNGIADDTTAFQNAVNAAQSVYVPSGTYIVNVVTITSNTNLYGDGASSVIKQSSGFAGNSQGSIYANSNSSSATVDNISIRNLRIEGTNIGSPVFSEFKHLVSLNGVSNVLIENVEFVGFQGDGLYIGSGIVAGNERHNTNVIVKNCYFNGVNKENRNGISVIDCNGFLAEGNYFTKTTKSTMPGAIDVEPDNNSFHVVKDIKIVNNKFADIGGNAGAISVFLPDAGYTTNPNGFLIQGNYLDTVNTGVFVLRVIAGGATESTLSTAVNILNNSITNSANPFKIGNLKSVVLADNMFINSTTESQINPRDATLYNSYDIVVRNNMFVKCASTGDTAIAVTNGVRITFDGNVFNDCGAGVAGQSNAIDFVLGTSQYINIINNTFLSPTGKTLVAIQKEALATLTPATNTYLNNANANNLGVNFTSQYNDTYETAYTPVVVGLSTPGVGTYNIQYGYWKRIGKTVFFRVYLDVASHTGTGRLDVTTPTAIKSGSYYSTTAVYATGLTSTGGIVGVCNPNLIIGSVSGVMMYSTATGTAAQVTVPVGAFIVSFSGCYEEQ